MSSVFNIADVMAGNASPATFNAILKDTLVANDGACYAAIERLLLPPGFAGSRSFDQAYAVDALLKHDSENGGRIATYMESTTLSRRMLWDRLYSVLRSIGFKMQHGRIVGVIEDKRSTEEKNSNDGQPDTE